ncbi:MAG: LEA type 2 family protein [Pigmentiphaga sp.]|uniref:LEA type 2 family protein n=1 Tax=Pigmentiphaga sp. TaxID=1977564 RepID=UPI0029B4A87D|nr:LEA type 2 family protein [Pigmentiphaga sp.]MDX3905862.1 LEA type 2 family protein [Pigmentiphaga sp.]
MRAIPSGFSPLRRHALVALFALAAAGCAHLPGRDPLEVQVAGIEPLQGEGLEMRLAVKLRVQNPNDSVVDYDGAALELELNGRRFATGVSSERGSVPRFGETVLTVPVSVSAFNAIRQALGMADSARLDDIPYVVRGKLSGGVFGTTRFSDEGTLSLPGY